MINRSVRCVVFPGFGQKQERLLGVRGADKVHDSGRSGKLSLLTLTKDRGGPLAKGSKCLHKVLRYDPFISMEQSIYLCVCVSAICIPSYLNCAVSVLNTGEPFSQEEMNEMLTALADQDNNHIYYKDFIGQLTVDTEV